MNPDDNSNYPQIKITNDVTTSDQELQQMDYFDQKSVKT